MSLPLLHSPADVLRWLIVALGDGSDPTVLPLGAWPVYKGNEPDVPDNCITVYGTTGQTDGRSMVDGKLDDHFGCQIRLRSVDDPTGNVKAILLRKDLAERVANYALAVGPNNYTVWAVSKIGQIIELGTESPTSKRQVFTLNVLIALTRNS